jgi:N-acetylmuramoyl-L-alanine amidase
VKKATLILGLIILAVGAFLVWLWPDAEGHWPAPGDLAAQVFNEPVTAESLRASYAARRFRILLVPGHDNDYRGAEFGNLREADLTLKLAAALKTILDRDDRFEVISARDLATGEYDPLIADYLNHQADEITSFRLRLRQQFLSVVSAANVPPPVHHNFAPEEVANRLYGLNKWANENKIDLTLHLHFNDDTEHRPGQAGEHSGFVIYVPEDQYANAPASLALAQTLFKNLGAVMPVSDLKGEAGGLVPDRELIAVGANGSREGAALLVEYGYIYEPLWRSPDLRPFFLPELAWQTYRGLKTFFEPEAPLAASALPGRLIAPGLRQGLKASAAVLNLQLKLATTGLYPPAGQTLRDCPLSGNFGPCVAAALRAFQTRELLPATGQIDEATLAHLNAF